MLMFVEHCVAKHNRKISIQEKWKQEIEVLYHTVQETVPRLELHFMCFVESITS